LLVLISYAAEMLLNLFDPISHDGKGPFERTKYASRKLQWVSVFF
jgi:hypothetical protein